MDSVHSTSFSISGVAQKGMVDLAAFDAILNQHKGQFPRK